jgi:hypothetical protein
MTVGGKPKAVPPIIRPDEVVWTSRAERMRVTIVQFGEPAAMRQDPAGFGDWLAGRKHGWIELITAVCWRINRCRVR